MKDNRLGDWLWEEWDGLEAESVGLTESLIYCTYDWVDLSNEVVKRALASCLQRDGVVDSLSDGFRLVEHGKVFKGYAGYTENEDRSFTLCSEDGITDLGDFVDTIIFLTLVELQS